ncbi:hypothetical protein SKAU_G00112110 [Synaphobranchus kaupii]|uniref:Uncharacterized protein n=1 Tax=Synaphobranchus kaupii TaxID=118154 RepID=A0A9Q1G0G8_SYNKA|nr:hypothetical protein SKAU_G00112110 [Synaphobranchus kaupii]
MPVGSAWGQSVQVCAKAQPAAVRPTAARQPARSPRRGASTAAVLGTALLSGCVTALIILDDPARGHGASEGRGRGEGGGQAAVSAQRRRKPPQPTSAAPTKPAIQPQRTPAEESAHETSPAL